MPLTVVILNWVVGTALAVKIAGVLLSIVVPRLRVWPPRAAWHFYLKWSVTYIVFGGLIILAVLTWDTWVLEHWLRIPLGAAILAAGYLLNVISSKTLGFKQVTGVREQLVTIGVYRWSRNPQYVGLVLLYLGLAVLANSLWVTIFCLGSMLWPLLAPLAEEPVLEEEFGEEYTRYKSRVRRFL